MSNETLKIGIVGGDGRQAVIARRLTEIGAECAVWGFPYPKLSHDELNAPVRCACWECAVTGADAVILPLPVTIDGVRVNCRAAREIDKSADYGVRLTEIAAKAAPSCLLLAGKVPSSYQRFVFECGKKIRDYY